MPSLSEIIRQSQLKRGIVPKLSLSDVIRQSQNKREESFIPASFERPAQAPIKLSDAIRQSQEQKPRISVAPTLKSFADPERDERIRKEAEFLKTPTGFASAFITELPKSAKQVGKDIAQGIARNIGSAGITLSKAISPEAGEEVSISDFPRVLQPLASKIFGEEPIKSIEQRIVEAEPKIREWGKQQGGTIGELAQKNSLTIAFAGVFGSVGFDLIPFGGLAKNAAKQAVKTTTKVGALSLLKKLGVADDIAWLFADDIVKVAKETDAEKLLIKIAEVQKGIGKAVPEVAPRISKELESKEIIGKIQSKRFGEIDLRTGEIPTEKSTGFGQVKIKQKGIPIDNNFIRLIDNLPIKSETKNRIILEDENFRILLSKDWLGKRVKPWLMNAVDKKKVRRVGFEPTTTRISVERSTAELPAHALDIAKPKEVVKPTPQDTINKLIKAIDESIPLRGAQQKLYQQELAKRTARVAAIGEKITTGEIAGEKGFFAQLGQLKGPLPKAQFEAIRKQFSQAEVDDLSKTIEQVKTLLPLEKVATKIGLNKLFTGVVPTANEIGLLREVFPKELIDALIARAPLLEKITKFSGELINVPRTIMASIDMSFGFRQGIFMLGRPKQFFSAFKEQFKFLVSEKAYQGLIESIKTRPTYLKMRQAGLALTEIGGPLLKREEAFMGQLAERIPIFGSLVRASNRAYTGFANKLRADLFDDILRKAQIAGKDIDDRFLKSLADFINSGTGRGKFGLKETGILPKSLEKAAPVMNALFFSPRLMASRLNLLNPYFYIQLDPFVRKQALKTLFADTAIFGSLYGLWKLNGGEVGLDPRSADFGKLKIGNTRYDVLGGFQQYIRLASQLITGEIISSTTGRTITLGEGYKPLTRQEIITRFFENKTSPIASFIIGMLKGQTATGEDFDLPTEAINRFIPMVVQDMYDISQEKGSEGLLYGIPAIFGVGAQTYGKQELKFGESKIGEPTAQVRPIPELAEKIRELVLGQLPLGSSKSFSVEAYLDQLSNLPRNEANDIWNKIKEINPELTKKISDVVKERQKGITVKDKDLKAKGVASGDRALAIKKELDKLKTREEKNALWKEYVRKGVITKEVARQLRVLLNQ